VTRREIAQGRLEALLNFQTLISESPACRCQRLFARMRPPPRDRSHGTQLRAALQAAEAAASWLIRGLFPQTPGGASDPRPSRWAGDRVLWTLPDSSPGCVLRWSRREGRATVFAFCCQFARQQRAALGSPRASRRGSQAPGALVHRGESTYNMAQG